MSVFYESYGSIKGYTTPELNEKHIRRFDLEVWAPAAVRTGMRCLEIGCGTGHFLDYLRHKGITDSKGIDIDPALTAVVPSAVRDRFHVADVWAFLDQQDGAQAYDRIFMFDVFEHFETEKGRELLLALGGILADDGAIVLKMPNAGSPWGLQFQHGDLTHVAAYTPESIRHMALSAGLRCTACYPHRLGSRQRQRLDRFTQAILNKLVATPPEIWEGNFFAILRKG